MDPDGELVSLSVNHFESGDDAPPIPWQMYHVNGREYTVSWLVLRRLTDVSDARCRRQAVLMSFVSTLWTEVSPSLPL